MEAVIGRSCQLYMMAAGGAYPRSCPTCGLGGRCEIGWKQEKYPDGFEILDSAGRVRKSFRDPDKRIEPTFQPGVLKGAGDCLVGQRDDGTFWLTFYLTDKWGRSWTATVDPSEVRMSAGQPLREGERNYDARA